MTVLKPGRPEISKQYSMFRFILSTLLLAGMLYTLSIRIPAGTSSIPPLGRLLSPATGFIHNMGRLPSSETVNVNLPSGKPVQVLFDERMVPHIFAEDLADALFVQGYITAMHRLFQLDFSTRAAAGRLSEVLGARTLSYDRAKRQLGLHRASEKAIARWSEDPAEFQYIEAYSNGVNAWINSLGKAEYPLEYKILDFEPEAWSTYKTALFMKSMVEMLSAQQKDVEHTTMRELLGNDLFTDLFPGRNPHSDPVISPGTEWGFDPVDVPADSVTRIDIGATGSSEEPIYNDVQPGSNNWALAGSRTKSGASILCNDPHLSLNLPSIWYECHIVTPAFNCYGATLPGMPGIIIGFNEHIAWGSTNAGHDVMDWYQIEWADDKQTQYWMDGQKKEVEMTVEEYQIRGAQAVRDTIKYTVWGPVSDEGKYAGLAMHWMGMESPYKEEQSTFLKLNQARNFNDYMEATDHFVSPLQNFVFASRDGDIAIRISGQMPLRREGQGVFVQDGSKSSNGWSGRIPATHNPVDVNPARGFVSSANQVSTDTTYPYFYAGEPYFEDYRGRWLNRQLSGMDNAVVRDMMELQMDTRSLRAGELLPMFIHEMNLRSDLQKEEKAVLNKLAAWNYAYESDSEVPIFFEEWYKQFYQLVWDEFFRIRDSIPVAWPESWRTADLALHNPSHPFFDRQDTDATEDAPELIFQSFRMMTSARLGEEEDQMQTWGTYKHTQIRHLTRLPAFSRYVPGASGHGSALNATTQTHGPSWRMIVELTDPVQAWVVYPGGQSGTPGDPFYDNMVDDWVKGNYHRARFVRTPHELDSTRSQLTFRRP